MSMVQWQSGKIGDPPVRVSSSAANMVSSLHPYDKSQVESTLATIRSSVLDPTRVKRIVGVENAFVARAGNLRVVFKMEGDAIFITSIVKSG